MKKIIGLILIILMICSLSIQSVYAADVKFSRGSFCKKIVETLGIEIDSNVESSYEDIEKSEYYDYIVFMSNLGFMNGYEDGTFKPERSITRAEIAKILTTMLYGKDFEIPDNAEYDLDYNSNTWYAKYAWKATSCGLMNSENNLFKGNDEATEQDINYNVMKSIVSDATASSDNVSLDLSQGSIVIENGTIISYILGANEYTQNGNTISTTGNCIIRQSDLSKPTANTITVSSSKANVTVANLNISTSSSPILVDDGSTLNLTLVGESTIISTGNYYAGIQVEKNSKIIINGSGKVSSTGGKYGAGIGNGGEIIINSGEIIANGGYNGAGIGGGNRQCDKITISGGNIIALGGENAAGIGDSNSISISGGEIVATGGDDFGAGVGGGWDSDGGKITISGGTVTATGGKWAVGIGCGYSSDENVGKNCTINICNATVTATGYNHAIGGGNVENQYGCNSIKISNSTVTLTKSNRKGYECQEEIYNPLVESNYQAALKNNYAYPSTNAYGASGLTYQWQVSPDTTTWTDIDGQTTSTANIKMTEENSGWYYRCKLTNGWSNVVYTDTTQCFILDYTLQPESPTVNAGDVCVLEVKATCDNVSYQWERSVDGGKSYTKMENEIYSTLIINADLSENDILYRCVITADNGDSLASNVAKITVVSPDVYYTERFYLQNANNDGYTAVAQNVVVSETGASVIASNKEYNGFVENTSLGTHSGTVTSDSSLALERYYDRKSYTITFDTNGGAVLPELTAKYGADIFLPTPSRYGYSFDGWYTDSNLINKADILTMPIDGATLYAKWNSQSSSSRDTEYKINALTLRNASNYEVIKSIPASNFIAEISVTNLSSVYTDTIIVATYDENGALIDLTYMYASVDIGETTALGTLIKNTDGNVSKVKAFVWSTLNSLKPLAESVDICK